MKTNNAYVNFPVVIPFLSEMARKNNLHLSSDLARACLQHELTLASNEIGFLVGCFRLYNQDHEP